MQIETIQYADSELKDPVAIVGFPCIGLVSSILSNMYITNLKMDALAGMTSPEMPPYCLISDLKPLPQVRFYAYRNKRKEGRDVILCMSEYTPKPENCHELSKCILSFLKEKGCDTIICLEGAPKYKEDDGLMMCGDGPNYEKLSKKAKIPRMTSGMVRGIVGVMLYQAPTMDLDIIALLCPANSGIPDPRSAAMYIEPISKIIPGFKINQKELYKEADEIQKRIDEQAAMDSDASQYIG